MTSRLPDRDARNVPDPIAMNGLGPKTPGLKHAARVANLLVARAIVNAERQGTPAALLPKLITVVSINPDVPVNGPDLEKSELCAMRDLVRLVGPGYSATLHTEQGFERFVEGLGAAARAELRAGANSKVPGVLVLLMSEVKEEGYAVGKMGRIEDVMTKGGRG